jgi:DNA-directed RNA polymerase subunit RPC12/RpoP
MRIRVQQKISSKTHKCLWCGESLTFYSDGFGVPDYNRAHCPRCKSNVFVFGKTQYKPISKEKIMNGEFNHGEL